MLAELKYDLTLDEVSAPDHDAQMRDGRRVQIKATFKNSLTFKKCPDYYLGLKLYQNGKFDEVFNGPGLLILKRYSYRRGIGKKQLSFPIRNLRALSAQVGDADRSAEALGPRAVVALVRGAVGPKAGGCSSGSSSRRGVSRRPVQTCARMARRWLLTSSAH